MVSNRYEQAIKKLADENNVRLSRAARWAQERLDERQAKPVAAPRPVQAAPEWAGVTVAASKCALAAGGVPGGGEAIGLILAICGIQDVQSAMLASINRDVALLRQGPFRTAQNHLDIAARQGPKHSDYRRHLDEADSQLIAALGQSASIQESALIQFRSGLVALLRDDRDEARIRLEESFAHCRMVVDELVSTASDIKVLNGTSQRTMVETISPAFLAYRGIQKLHKVWDAQRAATALEAFIPFMTAVTGSHSFLVDRRNALPNLQLVGSAADGYSLEWREPPVDLVHVWDPAEDDQGNRK